MQFFENNGLHQNQYPYAPNMWPVFPLNQQPNFVHLNQNQSPYVWPIYSSNVHDCGDHKMVYAYPCNKTDESLFLNGPPAYRNTSPLHENNNKAQQTDVFWKGPPGYWW